MARDDRCKNCVFAILPELPIDLTRITDCNLKRVADSGVRCFDDKEFTPEFFPLLQEAN